MSEIDPIYLALKQEGFSVADVPAFKDTSPSEEENWIAFLLETSSRAADRLEADGLISGPLWERMGPALVRSVVLARWWPLAQRYEDTMMRIALKAKGVSP
jgi:hypothetical protein